MRSQNHFASKAGETWEVEWVMTRDLPVSDTGISALTEIERSDPRRRT